MYHRGINNNPEYGICQRRNIELDIFLNRINFILAGRKITPWAKSLGLTNGDVTRIKAGKVPGPEKLAPICRAENVSLSWLLEGIGEPFMVHHTYTDEETAELVNEHISDESWQIWLLKNESYPAVVLTMPATMLVGKNDIEYTAIEIIAGPVDEETYRVLNKTGRALEAVIDEFTMRKIYAGKVGNDFFLYRPTNTLLEEKLKPLSMSKQLLKVAEPKSHYIIDELMRKAIEYLENACLEKGIILTPEQKSRAITAVYKYMQRTHSKEVSKESLLMIMDAI